MWGGKLQCVSNSSCVFCYIEIKGQDTPLPALRERDMYLLQQQHWASYSWESNALPVTTLIYPLNAWEFTWRFKTPTHIFARPVCPPPASSFTVHWAHLPRLVLLFNWDLLQPWSTSLSSEHGVPHTTSDTAQDTNLGVTQKDISTPDLQGGMSLHPQAAGQEEALHQVPSRDGAVRSCGGTGNFGQGY